MVNTVAAGQRLLTAWAMRVIAMTRVLS